MDEQSAATEGTQESDGSARPSSQRTVGRYEILREVGRGGMAVVYLARQVDLDRLVALKELSAFHAGSPEFAERFLRESRLAGSLSHPNVVTVHEYFEESGIPHIAMEYVPAGSLRPWVGSLTLPQLVGVLEGILAALSYAEPSGIVHRDLKPENIMVTADGRVKVGDFGIAKATQGAGTAAFMTATGMTVGTPTYMAPEQAMAQEIGPWTDLYSVGVIAHEQIVGHAPFQDSEAPMVILMRHVNERIPSVAELKPNTDSALSDWIDKLLVKDHTQRTRTAAHAWDELEEIVLELVGPRWRRDARLPERGPTHQTPAPLTPAPFESQRVKTPDPGPAAPRSEFLTFGSGLEPASAVEAEPSASHSTAAPASAETPTPPGSRLTSPAETEVRSGQQATGEAPPAPDEPTGDRAAASESVAAVPVAESIATDAATGFVTFGGQAHPAGAEPKVPAEAPSPEETPAPIPASEAALAPSGTPTRAPQPSAAAPFDATSASVDDVAPAPAPRAPAGEPAPSTDRASETSAAASLTRAPSAAPAPERDPEAEHSRARPAPRLSRNLIAVAAATAVVAGVIGYVASSGGGSKSTEGNSEPLTRTVTKPPLSASIPASWQQGSVSPAGFSFSEGALKVEQKSGATVLAIEGGGVNSAQLLPTSVLSSLSSPPSPEAIKLGNGTEFYRYRGLRPAGDTEPETIYGVPTTAGAVLAVCETLTGAPASAGAECEHILGSLKLQTGEFVAPGPLASYGAAFGRVMSSLAKESSAASTKLQRASSNSAQAGDARRLAQAFEGAASAVRGTHPGPLERAANDALASALSQIASGYRRMAGAAGSGHTGSWNAGGAGVKNGLAAVEAALTALGKLGFQISR